MVRCPIFSVIGQPIPKMGKRQPGEEGKAGGWGQVLRRAFRSQAAAAVAVGVGGTRRAPRSGVRTDSTVDPSEEGATELLAVEVGVEAVDLRDSWEREGLMTSEPPDGLRPAKPGGMKPAAKRMGAGCWLLRRTARESRRGMDATDPFRSPLPRRPALRAEPGTGHRCH